MTITIDKVIENTIDVSNTSTTLDVTQNTIDVSVINQNISIEQTNLPINLEVQQNNLSLYDTNYPITIEIAGVGSVGKSSYEIEVEHGFVGTEAQWLISLQATGGTGGGGSYDLDYDGIVDVAEVAKVLETSRNITLSGDVTGSVSFNGSSDANIVVAVNNDSHTHTIATLDGVAPINNPIFTGLPQITARGKVLAEADTLNGGYF